MGFGGKLIDVEQRQRAAGDLFGTAERIAIERFEQTCRIERRRDTDRYRDRSSARYEVREQVVKRQHTSGHMAGSWDPDDSLYGTKGGRIYCTALATLTLEVYYRFLRLYDDPKLPSTGADATVQGAQGRLSR